MAFILWFPWNPPKPQSKLPGYVVFRITPKSYQLQLRGNSIDTSEGGITLKAGTYLFQVSAKGYHPHTVRIKVDGDDATILRARLRPIAVPVSFKSEPSKALLTQNKKPLGSTPFLGPIVPGWYTFRVEKQGYVGMQRDIHIKPNRSNQAFTIRLGGLARKRHQDKAWMHWIPPSVLLRGSRPMDIKRTQHVCKKHRGSPCPESWFSSELPSRKHKLRGFWLDRWEVSTQQYLRCVKANVCTPTKYKSRSMEPAAGVSWRQASTYCAWVKGRLPTEAEWEFAARGPDGRLFPWGSQWDNNRSNHGRFHPQKKRSYTDPQDGFVHAAPVDRFRQGRSPYGLYQMAGNVAEWVSDCYYASYYREAPKDNPEHRRTPCNTRVLRGGSWLSPAWEVRTTARQPAHPTLQSPTVGFRCALDDKPLPSSKKRTEP
ncbi:MAG: PEGA domain-containing protein [Deltaproteobacteria bacterium]|nr:MAG: PEGA domain-containing protein [Deltaproteobacteria bacterium]